MSEFSISREDGPSGGRYVTIDVGRALVEAAVNNARKEGFKIIPLCPFAKATLDKTPEWQDAVQ